MSKYEATIGLELHCELKSNSKVFSPSKNSYDVTPNNNVCAIDLAFPGTLPVVNKECVKKALMMSMALNCKQPEYMCFDRKNYYYPDLPKGYQITQFYNPVGTNGEILINYDGKEVPIQIHEIHLEEDTAALEHLYNTTTLDYNRAGVPLLELVTEPCITCAEEAIAFIETIIGMYRYCDISEVDTKKGQLRCDVNVSIKEVGSNELGTKVEVKNVNSLSNIAKTIDYEIERQTALAEAGRYDEVVQETRRFDEATGTTIHMRSKADAIDYKYFPEPNIPPIKIDAQWLEDIRREIPALQNDRRKIYTSEYGLDEYDTNIIIKDKNHADYFEKCLELGIDAKTASNWFIVQILGYLNKNYIDITEFYLKPEDLKVIIDEINKGTISNKQAKEIFTKACDEKVSPTKLISQEDSQISDRNKLEEIINNILNNNQAQIEAYHNGKTNLFDFFVGQVMKETRGKANPVITNEILNEKLNNN
ncbi:MAG: Asp-tRNA(Asn)/Glu-tRNA(Gln) amidotransferase subunit GatB [Bacilli bacterium]|nr:Asp-tRNA(Asn)/Glu-tRNA(Gln) amidotransferase subunit GatB [Bacilli bacterium]